MNGWDNRETWLVNLWISEGYAGGSDYVAEHAAKVVDDGDGAYELGKWIEQEVRENIAEETNKADGLGADLLGAALAAVNWHEIAEHYISDVEVDEEEES